MCGIAVVYDAKDAIGISKALRHRGPDTEGYARVDKSGITIFRSFNSILDTQGLITNLGRDEKPILVHRRYTTIGERKTEKVLIAAHPHSTGGTHFAYESHIKTENAESALVHNGTVDMDYFSGYGFPDNTGCDTEQLLYLQEKLGVEGLMKYIPLAYSCISISKNEEYATVYRDRYGIRPLWLGHDSEGRYIAASEDYAIRGIGGTPLREVYPGEIIKIYKGRIESRHVIEPSWERCAFEINYLAKRDSSLHNEPFRNGKTIERIRHELGKKLAERFASDKANFVTYVPRSPIDAAKGCAEASGLAFLDLYYKLETSDGYSERSFMQLNMDKRRKAIEKNLYVREGMAPDVGKYFILIDDSLVRGINLPVAIRKARAMGFEPVQALFYTPIIGGCHDGRYIGCNYGVAMPATDDFVASRVGRDAEKISAAMGVPCHFLSLDDMLDVYESFGFNRNEFCTECMGGPALKC